MKGTHIANMNAQFLTVRNLWPMFKIRSKVTMKVKRSKFMVLSERPCHKERVCQI